jgi:hypothetical protein
MVDPVVTDTLVICERVNQPLTDKSDTTGMSQCVDCRALVWMPVNAPPHNGCLCAYCNANGRPQRPGSTVV